MTPPLLGTLETALYADDLDAARMFWTQIMGLEEIVSVPGRHVFFRTSDQPRPQVIAAGNIGCMMQIGQGTGIPIVHTVELLDWATGGPRPAALTDLEHAA